MKPATIWALVVVYIVGALALYAYGYNQGLGTVLKSGEGSDEAAMAIIWPIYVLVRILIEITKGWTF